MTKNEQELRATALNLAIQNADRHEQPANVTDRAAKFLAFLNGDSKPEKKPKRGQRT